MDLVTLLITNGCVRSLREIEVRVRCHGYRVPVLDGRVRVREGYGKYGHAGSFVVKDWRHSASDATKHGRNRCSQQKQTRVNQLHF